jgi:hypothetical protein
MIGCGLESIFAVAAGFDQIIKTLDKFLAIDGHKSLQNYFCNRTASRLLARTR